MIKLLQSHGTATAIGSLIYLLTTVLCWQAVHPSSSGHESVAPAAKPQPSWAFHNPEIAQLIMDLKKEKEALALKERELEDLKQRLQTERQELNQVTQSVHELQMEFDKKLLRVEDQEAVNLKRLAKMYAAMAPENATPILKQMDEGTFVKIMTLMKESEASPILEALGKMGEADAKRAADVSERFRLAFPKPLAPAAVR